MRSFLCFTLLLLCLLFSTKQAVCAEEELSIVSADIPPYSIEVGLRPGMMVEIVDQIENKLGLQSPRHFYPWSRAQVIAKSLPNQVIFPLTRTPDREDHYDWAINVLPVDMVFVSLNGQVVTMDDAKNLDLITVQKSTPFEEFLKKEGFTNIVSSPQPSSRHLYLLQKQRVEAWFTSKAMAEYMIAENNLKSQLTLSEPISNGHVYIAFSKKFPPSLRQRYIDTYQQLKEDGTIDYILKQYR